MAISKSQRMARRVASYRMEQDTKKDMDEGESLWIGDRKNGSGP